MVISPFSAIMFVLLAPGHLLREFGVPCVLVGTKGWPLPTPANPTCSIMMVKVVSGRFEGTTPSLGRDSRNTPISSELGSRCSGGVEGRRPFEPLLLLGQTEPEGRMLRIGGTTRADIWLSGRARPRDDVDDGLPLMYLPGSTKGSEAMDERTPTPRVLLPAEPRFGGVSGRRMKSVRMVPSCMMGLPMMLPKEDVERFSVGRCGWFPFRFIQQSRMTAMMTVMPPKTPPIAPPATDALVEPLLAFWLGSLEAVGATEALVDEDSAMVVAATFKDD